MGFGRLLFEFWQDFAVASKVEQVGFILSLTGLSAIFGWIMSIFRIRTSRKRIDGLLNEVAALKIERDVAEKASTKIENSLHEWMPSSWLERSQKERTSGNEELAINRLGSGFDKLANSLSEVTIELANHHLSLMVGINAMDDLQQAERFAHLAVLLNPKNKESKYLLEEIIFVRGDTQEIQSHDFSFLPQSQSEAQPLILTLHSAGSQFLMIGRSLIALSIFRRAKRVAERAGLSNSDIGIETIYWLGKALMEVGDLETALTTVTDALPTMETVLTEGHRIYSGAQFLRADILSKLDRNDEALAAVRINIKLQMKSLGSEHSDTLSSRFLEARIVSHLSGWKEGLPLIQSLLPDHIRVLGENDLDVLASKHLEVQNLLEKTIYTGVLDKINDIIVAYDGLIGSPNPRSFATRGLKAQVLALTHNHSACNDELDSLLTDAREFFDLSDRRYEALIAIDKRFHSKPSQPTRHLPP